MIQDVMMVWLRHCCSVPRAAELSRTTLWSHHRAPSPLLRPLLTRQCRGTQVHKIWVDNSTIALDMYEWNHNCIIRICILNSIYFHIDRFRSAPALSSFQFLIRCQEWCPHSEKSKHKKVSDESCEKETKHYVLIGGGSVHASLCGKANTIWFAKI